MTQLNIRARIPVYLRTDRRGKLHFPKSAKAHLEEIKLLAPHLLTPSIIRQLTHEPQDRLV